MLDHPCLSQRKGTRSGAKLSNFQRFVAWPTLLAVFPLLVSLPAAAQFSSAPGFGNPLTRRKIDLNRRLPPVVNIAGKSLAVVVQGQGNLPKELQSATENLLTRGDSNVQVGGAHPDLAIVCSVTMYSAPKMTSTKQNNITTDTFTGALSVAFRIAEPGSGRVIRSGTASAQVDQQAAAQNTLHFSLHPLQQQAPGGAKINSTMDAENALVADVSRQMASYVVNTDETVPVLLATGGSLNAPDKLATNALWSRDLEDLETLAPFADPRVDAYRLYNIGVANEALAYQAQDKKAAVKFLQEASIDYGKALAARSDEKYFLEPQNRIKTAIAHYDTAAAPVETSAGLTALSTPNSTPSSALNAASSASPAGLTNADVVAMVQAHMDQANILDNIQTAPRVSFDLSVDGQVKLLHSGVNNQLLLAMKQKARSASSSAGR